MIYTVLIQQTTTAFFEVEATTAWEATHIADDLYANRRNFGAGAVESTDFAVLDVQETEGAPPSAASIP